MWERWYIYGWSGCNIALLLLWIWLWVCCSVAAQTLDPWLQTLDSSWTPWVHPTCHTPVKRPSLLFSVVLSNCLRTTHYGTLGSTLVVESPGGQHSSWWKPMSNSMRCYCESVLISEIRGSVGISGRCVPGVWGGAGLCRRRSSCTGPS